MTGFIALVGVFVTTQTVGAFIGFSTVISMAFNTMASLHFIGRAPVFWLAGIFRGTTHRTFPMNARKTTITLPICLTRTSNIGDANSLPT